MNTVVLGIGQRYAGDDAVGLVVAARLRAAGVEARTCHDASDLVELAALFDRVVVVDAVMVDRAPGEVLDLGPDDLAQSLPSLSSHGLSVIDALGVVRALHGDAAAERVRVVGVSIVGPPSRGEGLSDAVEAAVEPAVRAVRALLEEAPCTSRP